MRLNIHCKIMLLYINNLPLPAWREGDKGGGYM